MYKVLASIFAASDSRIHRLIGLILLFPTFIFRWLTHISFHPFLLQLDYLIMLLFFLFIIYVLVRAVFSRKQIDLNTVFGATSPSC